MVSFQSELRNKMQFLSIVLIQKVCKETKTFIYKIIIVMMEACLK